MFTKALALLGDPTMSWPSPVHPVKVSSLTPTASKKRASAMGTMSEQSNKVRKLDFREDVIVELGTGADKQCFTVHKGILTRHSPFFKAACKEEWAASNEKRTIRLPDYDPAAFNLYLQILYTREVAIEMCQLGNETPGAASVRIYSALLGVYLLAHFVQDYLCCNTIVDYWIKTWEKVWDGNMAQGPSTGTVIQACAALPHDSKLLVLCRHQMCDYSVDELHDITSGHNWPIEMTRNLLRDCHQLCKEGRKAKPPTSADAQKYYEEIVEGF